VKNSTTGQKRILIVEDEMAVRQLCHRVLTSEGFRVDVAADGKVAQNMMQERQYDLYLIDIRLPFLDGKELYKWLQKASPDSAQRVMFTTGSATDEDTRSFLRSSGRQVLTKPFTPEELKTKVRQALKAMGG